MARIEDLREKFKTAKLKSDPKSGSTPSVGVDLAPGTSRSSISWPLAKYKVSSSGDDALLKFGKHRGSSLKTIVKSDPSYLRYIIKEDFPTELKEVSKIVLKEYENSRRNILSMLRDAAEKHAKVGRRDLALVLWDRIRSIRKGGEISKEDYEMVGVKFPDGALERTFITLDDPLEATKSKSATSSWFSSSIEDMKRANASKEAKAHINKREAIGTVEDEEDDELLIKRSRKGGK